MRKRIIVGGAGGTPALNFIRSLRKTKEKFYLIGITSNKYDLYKAKKFVDACFLVPLAKDTFLMPFSYMSMQLNKLCPKNVLLLPDQWYTKELNLPLPGAIR